MPEPFIDHSAVDEGEAQLEAALNALSPLARAAQRRKLLTVFDERLRDLFVIKMKIRPAGAAHEIASSRLEPQQLYWDILAAIRAGNLNWDVELGLG